MVDKRIFDDPNHPEYGPVRRTWVVLVQLDMLEAAERWSRHYKRTWDSVIAESVIGRKESHVQRDFIYQLMEGWI